MGAPPVRTRRVLALQASLIIALRDETAVHDRSCPAKRSGYCVSTLGRDEALVGIAGEDDLDVPDLLTPIQKGPGIATPSSSILGGLMAGSTPGVRRTQSPKVRSSVPAKPDRATVRSCWGPRRPQRGLRIKCPSGRRGCRPMGVSVPAGQEPADGSRCSAPRGGLPSQTGGLCHAR